LNRRPTISLAVITKDEERNIARCIGSCEGLVDEVVVVDSGSRDRTVEIARSLGARVIVHPFDNYAAQKNRAVDAATCDWVLNLDADEWVSDGLRQEIAERIASAPERCASIGFPRFNRICGRWPRFGGWRERCKQRLWRRGRVRWMGTVHEWGEVEPGYGALRIASPMLHDLGDDWERYRAKQLHYAALQAAQMGAAGRTAGPIAPALHAASAFCRSIIVQGGLLEGALGLRTASLRAAYAWNKWERLRLMRGAAGSPARRR
jgi:glycosyltransferase involved in cell wall biosynthesis